MKSKCSNLEITTIIIIFLTSADWKPLKHLFLFLNFASKKNAASEVLLVELNTKSEKRHARPGKEIIQPTILSYNHILV
jgi:hypothetical protein